MKSKLLLLALTLLLSHTIFSQITSPAYTAVINSTCVPASVTFSDVLQSTSTYTVNHKWLFDNGNTSILPEGSTQNYLTSGTYKVIDSAFISKEFNDTYLKIVTVTGVGCSDPSGEVDLFLTLISNANTVNITPFVVNTSPPVLFDYAQLVGSNGILLSPSTNYDIFVQDDDAISGGLPGPANCGLVSFNSDNVATSFSLAYGSLGINVELFRVSEVRVYDTIVTTTAFTVYDLPTVLASTSSSLICTGDMTNISATGAENYTWSTNETTSVIAVSPEFTTIYTVEGIDDNGCKNNASVTQNVSACTGVDNLVNTDNDNVNVFPNPTKGQFTMKLKSDSKVTVSNNLGQEFMNDWFNKGNHSINLVDVEAGIYYVRVVSDNSQTIKRIVISK